VDTGWRTPGDEHCVPSAGRQDCGGGLGTPAGNGSQLNGDGGAAVLLRLSGSWTVAKIPGEENGLEKIYSTLSPPAGIWCYRVGGGQASDVGETCVSAG
jgi:hypothetical protein